MDDKGRCLEHLSQQVERLTLVEVQRLFLSGDVEAGARLLSQWEHYIETSKTGLDPEKQETLSSTIKLYNRRLEALQNVLTTLPRQKCVEVLLGKLNALEARFATAKSGVGGGTFEWVDSVLVKCLREGSWLVIENVNLCSPAVLDRLNGLLEPGGELIMGERGVESDGQLVTVKPHPDFRLFLVMDPHLGEISRAMRNRGVEMCLLDFEEKPLQFMDLQAILNHIGICEYKNQKVLINIYEKMKDLNIGFENITINHLFQAASLTVQQATRGHPFSASLHSACSDVYIKGRQLTLEQKERCSRLFGEIFSEQGLLLDTTDKDVRDALDTNSCTLGTLALQENSALAQIGQKCALLSAASKLVEGSQNISLRDLLKEDSIGCEIVLDKHISDVIPNILLTLLCSLSQTDVHHRRNFIVSIIHSFRESELRNRLLELEKYLISTVQEAIKGNKLNRVDGVQRKDLGWDLRRLSPWMVQPSTCDYENKTIALMFYFTQLLQLNVKLGEIKTKSVKNMSAVDFSTAYNKGTVTVASVNSKLVLDLSVFLEAVEDQIHSLQETVATLDEEQCCQLIAAFHWSHRLLRVGQHKLFVAGSREMEVSEELTKLLSLHINWVKKRLLPPLTRLLKHIKKKTVGKTLSQLSDMCSEVSLEYPIQSLSKRMRGSLGQPLPLYSRLQGELSEIIIRLEKLIDLANPEHQMELVRRRVDFLLSPEGKLMRSKLAESYKLLCENDSLEKALEPLKNLEQTLPVAKLTSTLTKEEEGNSARARSRDVQLWAVKGVVCLRLMAAVCNSQCEQLAWSAQAWAQALPLVPPTVLAVLDTLADCRMSGVTQLTMQLTLSPVVTSSRVWLTWGERQAAEAKEMEENFKNHRSQEEQFSLQNPLVAVFTTAILYPHCHDSIDHGLATPSLRNHEDQTSLLAALTETIWTTAPGLALSKLNYRENEAERVENSYKQFLHAMESAVESKCLKTELSDHERSTFALFEELVRTKKMSDNFHNKSLKGVGSLLQDMARYMETLERALSELRPNLRENAAWLWIGMAWAQLGLLQLTLFAHQHHVDPVQKKSLKVQYCQEEREELERSLAVEHVQGLILGSYHFPLADAFIRRVDLLKAKEETLKKYVAERPTPNVYTKVYNEIQQLLAVMVSPSRRVETVAALLCEFVTGDSEKDHQQAVSQTQLCRTSLLRSAESLVKHYGTWYPDVVVPVVSAISQMSHGLSLMIGAARCHNSNRKVVVEPLLKSLVRFPVPDCCAAMELVDICTSTQTLDLIQETVKPTVKEGETPDNETFRLAKCSLQELRNVVSVRGRLDGEEDWAIICQILDCMVVAWQRQEQARAQKEQEESNYFINKARKTENFTEEEEEDAIEMRKVFPSYRDKDFADLEPPSLEQKKLLPDGLDTIQDSSLKLTEENIVEIHKVHSAIVINNTKAHWIPQGDTEPADFGSPFADRFAMFSLLLSSLYSGCTAELDSEVAPALCLGVHLANNQSTSDVQSKRKHYDFYHDPNPKEVRLCVPILESVTKRVMELLVEWPDHPTLNQIILVINRIMDFPSLSPVSRFLTGLELLLTKLKEWEENAHAGVTLGPHAAAVTRQVLDWRKLELAEWKGCLESARLRLCEGVVSKWWFHLYSLVREKSGDASQLASALEQFMESSNMAEYQTRLDLLYTFHCHCVNSRQKVQGRILWNVHQYYSQFSRVISLRVKELSQSVEKKLRDFVKIARWNDINYWAVKETVDRTHRTLFKYIREYESILKQPARSAMTRLMPLKAATTLVHNPALYVAPANPPQELCMQDGAEVQSADSLLGRERSLYSRARKLCRESVASCPLPRHISALYQIVEELQEISELLSTEDVDRTVSKEKQKSAARSVLHRKRKALTDLFHTLTGLGLSYRAGLVVVDDRDQFALHAPLNVDAGLTQIDNRLADRELTAVWTGCDQHFLHSVALVAQLRSAFIKPHKDLGPPVVDRCKGYTNHLMSLCHDQKRDVGSSVVSLYVLRCLVQCLVSLQPPQADVIKLKNDLMSLLEDIIYGVVQFEVLLDTCPVLPNVEHSTPLVLIPDSADIIYKGDDKWERAKLRVSAVVKTAKKCKKLLEEKEKYTQFLETIANTDEHKTFDFIFKHGNLPVLKEGYVSLTSIKNEIKGIQSDFRTKTESDINPMVRCLHHLQEKIDDVLGNNLLLLETSEDEVKTDPKVIVNNKESSIESLLNKVLFSIQEVYKKNNLTKDENDVEDPEEESENKLFESHLKHKVISELQCNIEILQLPEVIRELKHLMENYSQEQSRLNDLQRCAPLLQQYSLLAQFLITQQISALHISSQLCSALVAVFVDLATKGFRVPEELLEEEGEGGETTSGGLGMGEGEGEKDVSDQIESQDQLEDAKKPGDEKDDEDKDCKEEEKGIEMSDDFGGKLQDIEKKEDEDGSGEESGEEEEPDKEMGDTEKGAETLDQQIWDGSDSEDEEGEGDKEEEQGDRGEQTGEKEMGAKDDGKVPQAEEDDKQGVEEKDKKKEVNEMEEPDVDDDQIDPYHGNNKPPPEPEPMDLPDDLQLDDGNGNDKDEEGEEENPFDIDAMKEPKLPEEIEEMPEDKSEQTEKDKEDNSETDSSDEEGEEQREGNDVDDMEVDETNKEEDALPSDDGGAKDKDKTGEEEKMEEEKEENKEKEDAKPSEDQPATQPVPSSHQDSGSKDQVERPEAGDESKELSPEESAADGRDQQGVGAAQAQQQETQQGSRGESQQAVQAQSRDIREEKRERPGESEEQRALGDVQEPLKKKLKTINMEKESEMPQEQRDEEGVQEDQSADMYQHIKEAKESMFDAHTLDAATEEQAAEQNVPNKEDETGEEVKDDTNMTMDQDEEKTENEEVTSINPKKMKENNDANQEGAKQPSSEGERVEADAKTEMDVEGDLVDTMTVERGAESSFHTKLDDVAEVLSSQVDIESIRRDLELQLSTWSQPPANEEAAQAWERLSCVTADLARELSEQLRLVLEPTHASRLRGDFRTGRRINMRKVIPYIASQFRKDKIWLRRTKPAKREYQIVLAIDDSSSMADNHSKELAFESLVVVSKALNLLEAGQLAVLSFGDKPRVLHQLGDTFTEHSGARLLQQFSFEQQKTQVGALVNFACSLFARNPPRSGISDVAQLLVIVSDGRGVLNDGEEVVRQAVRRAKHMGIFMVFVIVDNPQSKDSILDIRLPKFSGGKLLGIVPYMDSFPFPFYLILRDIGSLPSVLSDALRQWFELVTNTS